MRKLSTLVIVCFIAISSIVISCNKSENKPIKNNTYAKESIIPLFDYYQFATLEEIFTVFSENGYVLNDADMLSNELNTYELDEGVDFVSFELELFKEGTFNFVSTSSDNQFKVSYILEKNLETFRVVGTSCTCTGCSDGCSPTRKPNGDCYCTVCAFVGSGIKCTKSESLSVGSGF